MNNTRIGYVYLTSSLGIDEQIKKAIRTHKITVLENEGAIHHNCPVLNFKTTDLEFPNELGKLGSCVLLNYPLGSTIPVVVGVVPTNDDKLLTTYESEKQRKFIKDSEECTISVIEDAESGVFHISVFGKQTGKSNFNIDVSSVDKKAKANVSVQGELNVKVTDMIKVTVEDEFNMKIRNLESQEKFSEVSYKLGTGLTIKDEFENEMYLNSNGLKGIIKKDVQLDVEGKVTLNSKGKINIQGKGSIVIDDASSIKIGNAASKALNVDTICQYTGQKHLPPPTNTKTDV